MRNQPIDLVSIVERRSRLFVPLALLLAAALPPAGRGATVPAYFDAIPTTAAIDGGPTNWSANIWKASAGATTGGAWADGKAAYFEPIIGTPSTVTITISGTVSNGYGGIHFDGTGYTITGGTLDIGDDWFYMVQPGTVNSALKRLQVYNNGELSIGGGGTLTGRAVLGKSGVNSVVRQTSGDITIPGEFMMIGGNSFANSQGTYILDSGTLTVGNGIYFGWAYSSSYGTFTQNGGTVETQTDNQGIQLGISGGHGTYNLNGGTLYSTFNVVSPGSEDFNFGGGTFKARANTATWASMTTTIGSGKTAYIDSNGKTVTWGGPISGASAAGLTKSGTGTLTLSSACSYAGTTTVGAGTLKLGNASSLGGTSGVSLGTNATLDLNGQTISGSVPLTISGPNYVNGADSIFNSSATAATYGGSVSMPTNAYIGGVGCGPMNFTGNISGAGYFAVIFGGTTVKLSGVNTFGTFEKRTPIWGANTLQVQGGSAIPDDNRIQLSGTATFELLSSETVGNLDCGATTTVKLNDKTLTFGGDNGSYVFPAAMSGSGGAIEKTGTGSLTLSSANITYTGGTTIRGGTLALSGTSAINSSSGIVVNGATAKFLQTSSTASTPPITLTQGTVDGTNRVGNVTVADLAANTVASGNGGTGVLTTGNLTFNGSGTLNLSNASTLAVNTLALNNPAGAVTVNAGRASGAWINGNNRLIEYASFDGANFGNLKAGAIGGLTARQTVGSPAFAYGGNEVDLVVNGATPIWTGAANGNWTTNAIGTPYNWKLNTDSSAAEFLPNDAVLFDDTVGAGATNVLITDANVTPALVTFSNSITDYSLSGNPITGGAALVKSGSGTLTLSNANTYTGGTTINGGTVSLAGGNDCIKAGTALTLAGGTLALGVNTQTLSGLTINSGGGSVTGSGTLTNGAGGIAANDSATLGVPLASSANQVWTVASGKTLAVNGNVACANQLYIQGTGQATFGGTTYSAADFRANSGGTATFTSGNLTATTFVLAGSTTAGTINWNSPGTLNPGVTLYVGFSGAQGTFTQTAGTVMNGNLNGLEFNNNGIYNLNGGTLQLGARGVDYYYGGNPQTVCTLNFGGGTLQATASWTYAAGANLTYAIGAGQTAYIDTLGYNITLNGAISGSSAAGLVKSGTGTLALGGASSYSGTTTVSNGSLTLSGTGVINSSSGIVVNGAGAKFLQTSSTASTPPITLTQGTVDGTGRVGNVTVADLAANTVAAGNGGTGVLTTGDLTFDGSATLNLPNASTLAVNTLAFNNPAGAVTVNASRASGAWGNGTNKLIGYASFDGANFGNLKVGTISGLMARQAVGNPALSYSGTEVDLVVIGATNIWTGAANGDWTTNTIGAPYNWKLSTDNSGAEFLPSDWVLFDDTVGAGATNVIITDTSVTPASVTFSNSSTDYSLSGNPITGGAALVKSGTGTLTLSNANTYTGGTTISGGTVSLAGGNDRLKAGTALTLAGGTLALGGNTQTLSGITINSGGGSVTGSGTLTNSGNPAANGNFVLNGNATISAPLAGNLYVSGDGLSTLTFSGGMATNANRIVVGSGGNVVQDAGNVATSTYMMVGRNDGTAGPSLSGTGTYTINNGSLTVGAGIYLGWNAAGNTGVMTQNGGTVETMNNTQGIQLGINGGHGTYNLNGGTLISTFGLGGEPYNYQTFNFGGGTFKARTNTSALATMTTTIGDGKAAYIDANGKIVNWNGPISGASAAGLTVSSSATNGAMCLNADNTYAGDTMVNSGSVWLGNGTASGSVAGNIVINDAAAYVRFQRTGAYTIGNTISGPGYVIMGSGAATISGANSYGGGTTVSGGTLALGSPTALGTGSVSVSGVGGGAVDLNGKTITNAVTTVYRATGPGNGGCLVNGDTVNLAVINGDITLGGNNYFGGAGHVTLNGQITGGLAGTGNDYAIYQQGTGTWTFANPNNTYDGWHYLVDGGMTVVTKLANLNEASSLGRATDPIRNLVFFRNSGGTLKYVGTSASSCDRVMVLNGTANVVDASGTDASATLTLTGPAGSLASGEIVFTLTGSNAGVNVYQGSISNGSGTVSLVKSGSTTWVLAGTDTYTGATIISNGPLVIGGAGQLGGGSYAGAITNNGAFLYGSSAAQTLSGVISGTGSLTKTNSSTLTLTGNNTYTGATTISDGTLSGTGTLVGPVQVQAGGAIAPGPGLGTLAISNTLDLAGQARMKINKTGATLTSDLIGGVSTLTYGGTLAVTASGDALAAGDSFKLFDATNYTRAFASYDLPALDAGLGWDTSNLAVNGTIIVVRPLVSVSGVMALEGYAGLNGSGTGQRSVRFVATDSGDHILGTWDVLLDFTTDANGNGLAFYLLTEVPEGAAHLSAKTAWTLRQRLDLTFSDGAAAADFDGTPLRCGDLNDSNSVDMDDYMVLAGAWYQTTSAADFDGNGRVDLDDYFLMANHWGERGDSE